MTIRILTTKLKVKQLFLDDGDYYLLVLVDLGIKMDQTFP